MLAKFLNRVKNQNTAKGKKCWAAKKDNGEMKERKNG